METKHPHSSTSLPEGPKQQDVFQEPYNSHQPPSQSSQTYTGAPSSTGHGVASGQSMTATTADVDPVTYQTSLNHQHSHISTPDYHRDLSHIGSWATTIEPFDDALVIGSDSILFPNHLSGAAVNDANAGNESAGPVGEREDTNKEAVELLRAR